MTKYEAAFHETHSVLSEWLPDAEPWKLDTITRKVVERLIAKGVVQSTDPDDLVRDEHRTGALAPGRTVIGGDR